jgi:hypothetical protein
MFCFPLCPSRISRKLEELDAVDFSDFVRLSMDILKSDASVLDLVCDINIVDVSLLL